MSDARIESQLEFWRPHPTLGERVQARHEKDVKGWPRELPFLKSPRLHPRAFRDLWIRAKASPEAVDDSFLPTPVVGNLRQASLVILLDAPPLLEGDHQAEWPESLIRRARVQTLRQDFTRRCPLLPFFPLDANALDSPHAKYWKQSEGDSLGFDWMIRGISDRFNEPFARVQHQLALHMAVLYAFPYRRVIGTVPDGIVIPSMRWAQDAARALIAQAMSRDRIVVNASSLGAFGEKLRCFEVQEDTWVEPDIWSFKTRHPSPPPGAFFQNHQLLEGLAERLRTASRMFGPAFWSHMGR